MDKTLKTRRAEIGTEIYRLMLRAESSVQSAIEHQAELNAALARAPREASLALGYGQGVMARVARTGGFLADARGELVIAHTGLQKIQDALGVTLGWDDDDHGTNGVPPDKENPPMGMADVIPAFGRDQAA